MNQEIAKPKPTVWHVGVRQPDGKLRDARGEITAEQFGDPFDDVAKPYILKDLTEDEVRAVRSVEEHSISLAAKLAEGRWPFLPWLGGQQKRFREFADRLERLSRETDIWIFNPIPACSAVLADAFGEEAGYLLSQTAEGLGFTINRELKS